MLRKDIKNKLYVFVSRPLKLQKKTLKFEIYTYLRILARLDFPNGHHKDNNNDFQRKNVRTMKLLKENYIVKFGSLANQTP